MRMNDISYHARLVTQLKIKCENNILKKCKKIGVLEIFRTHSRHISTVYSAWKMD